MMIFMLYTTAAMALAPIKARYSEEAELVSIAAHLAEVNGYDWSGEDVNVDDYLAEVDSFFAPHKLSHDPSPRLQRQSRAMGQTAGYQRERNERERRPKPVNAECLYQIPHRYRLHPQTFLYD